MFTLTPAYGRDYKSKAAVLADLKANKDFIAHPFNGPSRATNRADLLGMGEQRVKIRYAKQTKVMVVTL